MKTTLAILNRASFLSGPPVLSALGRGWERRLPDSAFLPSEPPQAGIEERLRRVKSGILKSAFPGPIPTPSNTTWTTSPGPAPKDPGLTAPLIGLEFFIAGVQQIADEVVPEQVLGSVDLLGANNDGTDQTLPISEASTALHIAHPSDPRFGPRIQCDFSRSTGSTSPLVSPKWLLSFLERAQSSFGPIDRALSITTNEACFRNEIALLEQPLPRTTVLHLPWRTGNAPASLGLLGVHAALDESGVTLIMGSDSNHGMALVLSVP